MTLLAFCKGQCYNKAGLQLFLIQGAKHLPHVLGRSDRAAEAVDSGKSEGFVGCSERGCISAVR